MTVTLDAFTGTPLGHYGVQVFDVTGADPTTPIAQLVSLAQVTEPLTLTLGSAPSDHQVAGYFNNAESSTVTWDADPTNWATVASSEISTQEFRSKLIQSSTATATTVALGSTNNNTFYDMLGFRLEFNTAAEDEVEGSGALSAPAGETDATGEVVVSGVGPSTAPSATGAGDGAAVVAGAGAASAPPGVLAGTAGTVPQGSGALTAPPATMAGTGGAAVTGTGAVAAPPGEVGGAAGSVVVSAVGAPIAPAGTAAGTGGGVVAGSGAATAPPAMVAATGQAAAGSTGTMTAPAGSVAGVGAVTVTGDGTALAPAGVLAGAGFVFDPGVITGAGALTAPPAGAAGTGTATIDADGAGAAPAAVLAGSGLVAVTGTGTLTAPPGVLAGTGPTTPAPPSEGELLALLKTWRPIIADACRVGLGVPELGQQISAYAFPPPRIDPPAVAVYPGGLDNTYIRRSDGEGVTFCRVELVWTLYLYGGRPFDPAAYDQIDDWLDRLDTALALCAQDPRADQVPAWSQVTAPIIVEVAKTPQVVVGAEISISYSY
jgi:hypothetical protein